MATKLANGSRRQSGGFARSPHAAAGFTPLRFTHRQVRFEPAEVARTLQAVEALRRRAAA